MRDVRIALCENFASLYARTSHHSMRDVRIVLCEMFASLYARCSHRSMRDVRIAPCEMFASFYARCSHRSMRELRIALCELPDSDETDTLDILNFRFWKTRNWGWIDLLTALLSTIAKWGLLNKLIVCDNVLHSAFKSKQPGSETEIS